VKHCTETERVQAYLDGDLADSESSAFRTHLSSCTECALEVSLYRRVIDSIERAATWEPSFVLTERILDQVVPARVRRRWARRFATGYAAALAATLGAIAVFGNQPATRESAVVVFSTACRGLVQSLALVLHGLSVVVTGLASGWGLLEALGGRFAPLARAFASLFQNAGIALPIGIAVLACVLLLSWMRARGVRTRGTTRIGILGI